MILQINQAKYASYKPMLNFDHDHRWYIGLDAQPWSLFFLQTEDGESPSIRQLQSAYGQLLGRAQLRESMNADVNERAKWPQRAEKVASGMQKRKETEHTY